MNSPTYRFTPENYARVLAGLKTQTRRVMSSQPIGQHLEGPKWYHPVTTIGGLLAPGPEVYGVYDESGEWGLRCPYGPPGTIKPVVTSWAVRKELDGCRPAVLGALDLQTGLWWNDGTEKPAWAGRTRPAMFFPAHLYPLARQLRTGITKAERLQDISAPDALAEQFGTVDEMRRWMTSKGRSMIHYYGDEERLVIELFQELWDSINAKRAGGQYAYDRNPMVFATTFELVPAAE